MRFNPEMWLEVDFQAVNKGPPGRLHIQTSEPCSLWIDGPRGVVCADYGTTFKLDTGDLNPQFMLDGPASARAFLYWPDPNTMPARSGSFTNPDRPFDSSSDMMDAVLGQVRALEVRMHLQNRAAQKDARLNRERLAMYERQLADKADNPIVDNVAERKAAQAAADALLRADDQSLDDDPPVIEPA